MVLYDPQRKWGPRAICGPEDAKLFFAQGGVPTTKPGPKVAAKWEAAKGICRMCPVIKECRRDTLGEEYGVWGGLDQYQRVQIRRALPKAIDGWPESQRLRWAKEVYELREAGLLWRTIQTQTGLTQQAGEKLLNIWLKRLEERGTDGEVVDLPLPEEETDKGRTPFPDKPGRRDAWVRHRGGVSDAWYQGETPDGKWVRVTTTAGRGQVHKWIAADDVHLYRPQAVIILNYAGRPDDAEHDLTA